MSDTTEYTAPEVDPTEIGGQVEDLGGEAAEQSEPDYFDWNEYGDKRVKLPVAGEEIEVPLSEALAGYQRQADYTRKTQELSQQRQQVQFAAAIQQALDNDPANTIRLLQEHYGINDAAALTAANLSMAMGTGTDTAINSADITLMNTGLGSVVSALKLSTKTLKIIRLNMGWAFVYNVIGLPIAAAGLLTPLYAAAAMAASSVLVVTNSLRIK